MQVLQSVSTPTPTPTVDPDLVTPGVPGFITIVLLAVAVGLLAWDMLRRVRRSRYREEARLAIDAEQEAAREAEEALDEGPRGSEDPDDGNADAGDDGIKPQA